MSKNAKTLTQTQHGITIDCRYQQFLAIYISNPFLLPRFSIIGSIWCTGCFRYLDLSRASLEIFLCKMAFLKSPSRLYTLYYHHVPFAMLTPAEQLILRKYIGWEWSTRDWIWISESSNICETNQKLTHRKLSRLVTFSTLYSSRCLVTFHWLFAFCSIC